MPKDSLRFFEGRPLLDIASYGRMGPERRTQLTRGELDTIRRTMSRDPEVVVKVPSQGVQDVKGVGRHLEYIGRDGEVPLLTDDGREIRERQDAKELMNDWGLDLEELRGGSNLSATDKRKPPRLVHKLTFSMPPGTPPEKVFSAVQILARDEFGLAHRYAMALHTDEPHPHVHLVVKAMSEQGVRLNIKKAMLRMWRSEFARHLRAQGIRANATERLVRGKFGRTLPDGIYRAARRVARRSDERKPENVVAIRQALTEVRAGWRVIEQAIGIAEPSRLEQPVRRRDFDLER
jgi:hypothetical protein